jgi:predicted ATP-binding protein involved in virulence
MTDKPYYLETIKLQNFRCFSEITVDLHPRLTVLVAENGQGKTAILDAVRIGLWTLVGGFDLAKTGYSDPANTITIDDVLLNDQMEFGYSRQLPVYVTLKGNYLQKMLWIIDKNRCSTVKEWTRFRDSEARRSQTKDKKNAKLLKALVSLLQDEVRKTDASVINLPIFGYYGTGRLWNEKRLTQKNSISKTAKIDQNIRTFAYKDCLDPASSYKQFENWFTSVFKKLREEQIIRLENDESPELLSSEFKNPIKVVQTAVNEILKETGWQNLSYSETRDQSLVLQHTEKGLLKVDQLSDGIKNMLALVADIAYRCALLNPHLGSKAAIESEGLVMIDEVDMHLHPKWQQTVLESLLRAFPKIQFIVTTHSPQVLSTVHKDCIRLLGKDSNGQLIAAKPVSESYGEMSSDVLESVMLVSPMPPVPEKVDLERLTALVDQGLYQEQEAQKLLEKLIDVFGRSHPHIQKLLRSIQRQESLRT